MSAFLLYPWFLLCYSAPAPSFVSVSLPTVLLCPVLCLDKWSLLWCFFPYLLPCWYVCSTFFVYVYPASILCSLRHCYSWPLLYVPALHQYCNVPTPTIIAMFHPTALPLNLGPVLAVLPLPPAMLLYHCFLISFHHMFLPPTVSPYHAHCCLVLGPYSVSLHSVLLLCPLLLPCYHFLAPCLVTS